MLRAHVQERKQETLLSFSRILIASALLAVLSCSAAAQSKATLDVSETLFSVIAAINVCGYDQELSSSSPIRSEVRADLVEASKSPAAATAAKEL